MMRFVMQHTSETRQGVTLTVTLAGSKWKLVILFIWFLHVSPCVTKDEGVMMHVTLYQCYSLGCNH